MPFLCRRPRLFTSLLAKIILGSECLCSTLCIFCVWIVFPPLQVFLGIVNRLIWGFLMAAVVGIVYEWTIEPHFLHVLSNVCHRLLWWRYFQWTHPLMLLCLWFPLLGVLLLQDVLTTVLFPPLGVRFCVTSWDYLYPKILPWADVFLGLFLLF